MNDILNALKAFKPMANHVIERSTLPILNHIAITGGQMVATDLESRVEMPIDYDGGFTMTLKMLNQLIGLKPESIAVSSVEDDSITLSIDDPQILKFRGLSLEVFPGWIPGKFRKIRKWNSELVGYLDELIPFLSNDELKPSLMGVSYAQAGGEVELCATNGHMLKRVMGLPVKSQAAFKGIVPQKAITFLSKFMGESVDAAVSKTHIRFTLADGTLFHCRLVDERYPDYISVFPKESKGTFSVNRLDLLKRLKGAAPFVNRCTHQIALSISPNGTIGRLWSDDIENQIGWETDVPLLEHAGEGIEIGYNREYLETILKSVDDDVVKFTYDKPITATVITGDDPKVDMLLMPIRLGE